MNGRRACAHARVTMTLERIGAARLQGPERAEVRHAADTLLFCADLRTDGSARVEFARLERLLGELVASGRWSSAPATELTDAVWACGPGPDTVHSLAA